MRVIISMLRGVNVGGNKRMSMEGLRSLYASLGMEQPRTYVQSGNVVFKTKERSLPRLVEKLEAGILEDFGFQSKVIVRTHAEMEDVIQRNPFAGREGIHPGKLVVTFLGAEPAPEAAAKVLAIPAAPEELYLDGREMYIYFPDGQGRTKLPVAKMERILAVPATSRNWNSVLSLRDMAAEMTGK